MSEKSRPSQKLNNPDAFQAQAYKVMDWFIKNQGKLLMVILPIIGIVLAGYGVRAYQGMQKADRVEAVGTIEDRYAMEEKRVGEIRGKLSEQLLEIEKRLDEAREKKSDVGQLEANKAELEAKLKALKPDHSAVASDFQSFFQKNQNNPEGWAAAMRAAGIYLDNKDIDKAKGIVENLVKSSVESDFYQIHGKFLLASILEQQGDFEQAIGQLADIEPKSSDDLKPQVLLSKARLQLLKDQKDEAIKTLDALIQSYESAPEAQKARALKAIM